MSDNLDKRSIAVTNASAIDQHSLTMIAYLLFSLRRISHISLERQHLIVLLLLSAIRSAPRSNTAVTRKMCLNHLRHFIGLETLKQAVIQLKQMINMTGNSKYVLD